jgi:hypothetical protein
MDSDSKKYPKEKQLVTISQYSEKYKLNRQTVYRLLEEGKLTRYLGLDGEPMLDPDEQPTAVRKYDNRPEYSENKDDTD